MNLTAEIQDSKAKLDSNFKLIFGDLPTILTDSTELINLFKSLDYITYDFSEETEIPPNQSENVVIIPTIADNIPPYEEWNRLFKDSRVLTIPLLSFSSEYNASLYTMKLLADSDFEYAVKANEEWIKYMMDIDGPMVFHGENSNFSCELDEEDVHVMKPKISVEIEPGEWESIGSYFEVGMVPDPEDFRPGFIVNGTLSVPGVAIAHHRQIHDNLKPYHAEAWNLFTDLHEEGLFPLKVNIKDSHVQSILAGDRDISDKLLEITNKKRELVLTEMAFSTNRGIVPENIDWKINSQLNEGALGIHVGIGVGLTGIHIDLICPDVELQH
ncbi:hypothetical protein [Thalassobacillus devorans]|uniref:hypothetical protein n=1 Tax=Thalassobacillus devorans TaxID=279813 RepID=UPI000A1C9D99|nr:hypothetical protein [Thalassobacillus devorans]